jgi:hypothetical protein
VITQLLVITQLVVVSQLGVISQLLGITQLFVITQLMRQPRDDASEHKSIRLSIISALLKVFLFGIRNKLTVLWGN